ncbi:carboxymuconolactone decarboxylase family protein [Methanolobus sp.]|uniref:carboxymuconolactone decarboxylase family protein n=1 Tax=Methanolobus sp. TaxID=1874737 RepID=UPI0025FBBDD3|nr:carboxymuconolactone decarboxylase family protein [Methanolobus sp.]
MENPLQVIIDADPELASLIGKTRETALSQGAIPLKYKFLIAMALDAAEGAADGVRMLAMQAMSEGATKEEIMEAVRIAQYITGVGSVYTAANGLKGIL